MQIQNNPVRKISVIGDVMSESILLESVRRPDGSYDYDPVFQPLGNLLRESDFAIANLETPIAGEELGYSKNFFSFNAPESLVTALQRIGIRAVSTANNHAIDRKKEGFIRTLDTLDRLGMPHTGSYRDPDEKERNLYFTVGDMRIAVIAYTYGVNGFAAQDSDHAVSEGEINLLSDPNRIGNRIRTVSAPEWFSEAVRYIREVTGHEMSFTEKIRFKRILGVPIPYADNYAHDASMPYLKRLQEDYEEARKNADLVLFLPHIGGQFNTEPGSFSSYIVDCALKMGFDAVLASHAHTTQKAVLKGCRPVFYSLGNVSMSAKTPYAEADVLPDYGLVAHLYLNRSGIFRSSYSVFRIVEEGDAPMRIVPVDELYATYSSPEEKEALERDVAAIVKRVSGICLEGEDAIRREYFLAGEDR